jgi:hypothetical protein
MKSSNRTNRFPIGSIVGEYELARKIYINYFFINNYEKFEYTFSRLVDLDDTRYTDGLDDNRFYEYHLVSDGTNR